MAETPGTCPTCASAVRVLSSDEGTHAYAPLVSATVLRRVRDALMDLVEIRKEMADRGGMGASILRGAEGEARNTLRLLERAINAQEALVPDWVLCAIYSAWSEEAYAATWMDSGVRNPAFVRWLREQAARPLESYEAEDMPDLRAAFHAALHPYRGSTVPESSGNEDAIKRVGEGAPPA